MKKIIDRFLIKIIYPLYYSITIFNKNDEDQFPRLIKYWSLHMFSWVIERIIGFVIYR